MIEITERFEWLSMLSSITDLFSSAFGLFTYIAVAYGLYRMAQTIGLKNPFLAWIPYCQDYTLGAVADEYTRRNEGKTTTYRKKLLGWQIAVSAMSVLLVIVLVSFMVVLMFQGLSLGGYDADTILSSFPDLIADLFIESAPFVFAMLVALMVFLGLYIVYLVYHYTALHKVFKLFAPEYATVYLILSIFVPLATPILFLLLSKNQPLFTDTVTDIPEGPPAGAAETTENEDQNYYSL